MTAELDARSFDFFDGLRKKHFPPERNFLSAHLTLFHHLPADSIDEISSKLSEVAAGQEPIELNFARWRSLGRGVAIVVESEDLVRSRQQIADAFRDRLTPQDRQRFSPHITIQNKVEPAAARALLEELSRSIWPQTGTCVGLTVWRYLGGPWHHAATFHFE